MTTTQGPTCQADASLPDCPHQSCHMITMTSPQGQQATS
jgi:hypothetical protein